MSQFIVPRKIMSPGGNALARITKRREDIEASEAAQREADSLAAQAQSIKPEAPAPVGPAPAGPADANNESLASLAQAFDIGELFGRNAGGIGAGLGAGAGMDMGIGAGIGGPEQSAQPASQMSMMTPGPDPFHPSPTSRPQGNPSLAELSAQMQGPQQPRAAQAPPSLDQMPMRNVGHGGQAELIPDLGQTEFGQPGGGIGPQQMFDVGTADFGDGPERWVGQPTPPRMKDDLIREFEQQIADAGGAIGTSGPLGDAQYNRVVAGKSAALNAIRGNEGGLSAADRLAIKMAEPPGIGERDKLNRDARIANQKATLDLKLAELNQDIASSKDAQKNSQVQGLFRSADSFRKDALAALGTGDFDTYERLNIEARKATDQARALLDQIAPAAPTGAIGGGVNPVDIKKPVPGGAPGAAVIETFTPQDMALQKETGVPGATEAMIDQIRDTYGEDVLTDEMIIEELKRMVAAQKGG